MPAHLFRIAALSGLLLSAASAEVISLPNQTSTYSGDVRGYWFTAPVDITITGLFVPTTASTAAQSVEVVLLNAAPPNFSAVTNDFTSVFRVIGDPSTIDFMSANIPITAGQIVGILGWRGVINSYAPGPATTTIGGQSVTLRRMGMQFNLNTTNARDLWTEDASISRVLFSYDVGINGNAVPEPSTYALTLSAVGLLVGLHARKRKQTQKQHSPSSTNS